MRKRPQARAFCLRSWKRNATNRRRGRNVVGFRGGVGDCAPWSPVLGALATTSLPRMVACVACTPVCPRPTPAPRRRTGERRPLLGLILASAQGGGRSKLITSSKGRCRHGGRSRDGETDGTPRRGETRRSAGHGQAEGRGSLASRRLGRGFEGTALDQAGRAPARDGEGRDPAAYLLAAVTSSFRSPE